MATDNTSYGIPANTWVLENMESVKQPLPEKDGKIKTLNAMGYMTPDVDYITKDFIEFSANAPLPVLDGGAAYGVATILALKKGATVIANDIDQRHLWIIAQNKQLSPDEKARLFLNQGMLPESVDFPDHSLSAILLCRVMHFFTPTQIELMFQKAKRWLVPNGRFYIVTMTPYHYTLEGFSTIYQNRLQAGDPWPGIITSMMTDYGREHKGNIPEYLHVMDPRILIKLATEQGFMVKELKLFGHNHNPKENGLGYIGSILINRDL